MANLQVCYLTLTIRKMVAFFSSTHALNTYMYTLKGKVSHSTTLGLAFFSIPQLLSYMTFASTRNHNSERQHKKQPLYCKNHVCNSPFFLVGLATFIDFTNVRLFAFFDIQTRRLSFLFHLPAGNFR